MADPSGRPGARRRSWHLDDFRGYLLRRSRLTDADAGRLYREDPKAFLLEREAAWRTRELGAFVTLGFAQRAAGALDGKWARRLWRGLLALGRHAEALGLIEEPRFRSGPHAGDDLGLAEALAGLGRIEAALDAARRASALDPGLGGALALEADLAGLRDLRQACEHSSDWRDHRAWIDALLARQAVATARDALLVFLNRAEALAKAELREVHEALNAVCFGGALHTQPLFLALERFYPKRGNLADLARIRAVLDSSAGPAAPAAWQSPSVNIRLSGALAWAAAGRRREACGTLGGLTLLKRDDPGPRTALARVIGEDLLAERPLVLAPIPAAGSSTSSPSTTSWRCSTSSSTSWRAGWTILSSSRRCRPSPAGPSRWPTWRTRRASHHSTTRSSMSWWSGSQTT